MASFRGRIVGNVLFYGQWASPTQVPCASAVVMRRPFLIGAILMMPMFLKDILVGPVFFPFSPEADDSKLIRISLASSLPKIFIEGKINSWSNNEKVLQVDTHLSRGAGLPSFEIKGMVSLARAY